MTQPVAMQTRTSKSSLFSLIFGILGCVPFVTGALAMLLGLIGFFRAGKPGVKGRWMAVVGGLLGTASVGIWTLFFGSITAMIFAVLGMTAPLRTATHDFVRDLSTAPMVDLKAHYPGYSEADLQDLQDIAKKMGTFEDTTFTNSSIDNKTGHVDGTAKFSGGTLNVTAELEELDGKWRVTEIQLKK